MDTSVVTKTHREQQGLTVREFSDAINAKLINTGMSSSLVSRIENGHYEPPLSLLFECLATYQGTWIYLWAIESICAMYPDLVESNIIQFKLPVAQ